MLYQTSKSRYSYQKYCCCGPYEHQCGILFLTHTSSWIAKRKIIKSVLQKCIFEWQKKKKKNAVQHNKQYLTTPKSSSYWWWKVLLLWAIWTPMWYTFFSNTDSIFARHTLVSFEKKKIPTYRPKFTWNKQLKCFLTGELRLKCNMWQKCHNHCSFFCQ